jgi:hypothetical protein
VSSVCLLCIHWCIFLVFLSTSIFLWMSCWLIRMVNIVLVELERKFLATILLKICFQRGEVSHPAVLIALGDNDLWLCYKMWMCFATCYWKDTHVHPFPRKGTSTPVYETLRPKRQVIDYRIGCCRNDCTPFALTSCLRINIWSCW